ncbi:hypothetical protein ACOBV9_20890 (plasmid) [Pseudoalteromonas espejiana]
MPNPVMATTVNNVNPIKLPKTTRIPADFPLVIEVVKESIAFVPGVSDITEQANSKANQLSRSIKYLTINLFI